MKKPPVRSPMPVTGRAWLAQRAAAAPSLCGASACALAIAEHAVRNQPEAAPPAGLAPPGIAVRIKRGASDDQYVTCMRAVREFIGQADPGVPVQVALDMEEDTKVIAVSLAGRDVLRCEMRPAWTVGHLCRDAVVLGLRVLVEERALVPAGSGPVPPDQRRPAGGVRRDAGQPAPGPHPEVVAAVRLGPTNQFQVERPDGSVLRRGPRPSWPMSALCQDAAAQGLGALLAAARGAAGGDGRSAGPARGSAGRGAAGRAAHRRGPGERAPAGDRAGPVEGGV